MKKKYKSPLSFWTRVRLRIAARHEGKLRDKILYQQMAYGTVVTKKFNRGKLNPMRYILGEKGIRVVDTKNFFEEQD